MCTAARVHFDYNVRPKPEKKSEPANAPASEGPLKRYAHWVPWIGLLAGSGFLFWIASVFVDSRINDKLQATNQLIGDTRNELASMNGRFSEISSLIRLIVEREMRRLAALPADEFGRSLSEVKTALDVAKSHSLQPEEQVVAELTKKLQVTNHDLPDFWGAAAATINYRSISITKPLPRCLDKPAVMTLAEDMGADDLKMVINNPVYEDCEIELDTYVLSKAYANVPPGVPLHLKNCRVIYRGGSFSVPPGSKFIFSHCAFVLIPKWQVPRGGRDMIVSLLLSPDINRVDFKTPG